MEIEFDESEYEQTRKSIAYCLRRFMVPLDAADLTQEFYTRKLEGKSRCQSIEKFVIDYLRSHSGRKGTASYDKRKSEFIGNHDTLQDIERTKSADNPMFNDDSIDYRKYREYFKDKRLIELLELGYTQVEIALDFGVTVSRISQKVRALKKRKEIIDHCFYLKLNKNTLYFCLNEL